MNNTLYYKNTSIEFHIYIEFIYLLNKIKYYIKTNVYFYTSEKIKLKKYTVLEKDGMQTLNNYK